MQRDVDDLRADQRADHHRLRGVEDAVKLMLEAQKTARRDEDRQYRRLELKIQWGGLAMAFAMAFLAVVQIFATLHH